MQRVRLDCLLPSDSSCTGSFMSSSYSVRSELVMAPPARILSSSQRSWDVARLFLPFLSIYRIQCCEIQHRNEANHQLNCGATIQPCQNQAPAAQMLTAMVSQGFAPLQRCLHHLLSSTSWSGQGLNPHRFSDRHPVRQCDSVS